MITYLPEYYYYSRLMRSIMNTQGIEIDSVREALNIVFNRFFTVLSDDVGLAIEEAEFGLPNGAVLTLDERRERILARKRGYGTATIKVIKAITESYQKCTVNPIQDHAAYTVIFQFIDTTLRQTNVNDLKSLIREALPAHLDIKYNITNPGINLNLYVGFAHRQRVKQTVRQIQNSEELSITIPGVYK